MKTLSSKLQRLAQVAAFAISTIAVPMIVGAATPASAATGREAVNVCIDANDNGTRCAWSVNEKGEIDLCTANGCWTCPSASDQCVPARVSRPTRELAPRTRMLRSATAVIR